MGAKEEKKLHIVMYPWLALGHITPFLHLANKLASKGHKISLFLPSKAQAKLAHINLHPHLISFITVTIPPVDGLPAGAQLTHDVPSGQASRLVFEAFDLTLPEIKSSLSLLNPMPDVIFYDFAHWLPGLAREHCGPATKAIFYAPQKASFFAYMSLSGRGLQPGTAMSASDLMQAPAGFPGPPAFRLRAHEARRYASFAPVRLGLYKMTYWDIFNRAIAESDAACLWGCREIEGLFGDYFQQHYQKSVIWAGPVLPEQSDSGNRRLDDEKLERWLNSFPAGSVIYCALGSECVLPIHQFRELLLGLELTGLPFLAILQPPTDYETIESALPLGFLERVKGRGIIDSGWVQQNLILKHNSVGCFVSHSGHSSLLEALVTDKCKLVMMPQKGDQYTSARLMGDGGLRVGVEVETAEDDGFYTKEAICNAIMTVMKEETEVGREIRANHAKWNEFLLREGLEESYINDLVANIQGLTG